MALINVYWDDTAATDGNGTAPTTPRRCANAADWTRLWAQYGAPGGYAIHLAAGQYVAPTGAVNGNVSVLGAGIGVTTIQGNRPFQDNNVWVSDFTLTDLTLDLNVIGIGQGVYDAVVFRNGCDHVTLSRVKVTHFGTNTTEVKVLAFLVPPAAAGGTHSFQDVLVDGCVFTQASTGNTSACTLVTIRSYPGVNTVPETLLVQNCVFYDCDASDPAVHAGQPGAFTTLRCINAPYALNNYATNVNVFYYREPTAGFTGANLVQDNRLVQVGAASVVAFTLSTASSLGPLTLRHNYFERRNAAGHFFNVTASQNTAPATLGTVLIEQNWIQDVNWAPSTAGQRFINARDGTFTGTSTLAMTGVCVRTNLFFCAPQNEVVVDARPGVLKAFAAYGNSTVAQNADRTEHISNLLLKTLVANWYGARATYYDSFGPVTSNGVSSPVVAYSVESLRTVTRYLKNVWGSDWLFVPEAYGNNGAFSCSRPFRDVKQGQYATSPSTKLIWPTGAAIGRWETTTATTGQKFNIFPPGNGNYNATDYANTIEFVRAAYNAGDDMMATGTSGSPSDFQMAAYIFNRIANGTL